MRAYYIIVLLILYIFCTGGSTSSTQSEIEKIIISELKNNITITKVPRGLILSFDENVFFNGCNTKINQNSLSILDKIANILKRIQKFCVIENHTADNCSPELDTWEIAMVRAGNIAEYLIKHNSVPQGQIFDIGFGEFMPFNENINIKAKKLDNRVDFVIIDYDETR